MHLEKQCPYFEYMYAYIVCIHSWSRCFYSLRADGHVNKEAFQDVLRMHLVGCKI